MKFFSVVVLSLVSLVAAQQQCEALTNNFQPCAVSQPAIPLLQKLRLTIDRKNALTSIVPSTAAPEDQRT